MGGSPAPDICPTRRPSEKIIDGQDALGLDRAPPLPAHKVEPEIGLIDSQTFIDNMRTLCRYLQTR